MRIIEQDARPLQQGAGNGQRDADIVSIADVGGPSPV